MLITWLCARHRERIGEKDKCVKNVIGENGNCGKNVKYTFNHSVTMRGKMKKKEAFDERG